MPYKDKDKQRAAQLAYYYRRKEACNRRQKEWREKNKERKLEYDREYAKTHRDIRNRISRAYEARNPGRKIRSHIRCRYGTEWLEAVLALQKLEEEIRGRKKETNSNESKGGALEGSNGSTER